MTCPPLFLSGRLKSPSLRVDRALGSNGLAIVAPWVGYQ